VRTAWEVGQSVGESRRRLWGRGGGAWSRRRADVSAMILGDTRREAGKQNKTVNVIWR
jgi:hypothetical protein